MLLYPHQNSSKNKRKQTHSSSGGNSFSYRTPIDSPVPSSINRDYDDSEFDDNMDISRSEACSDYDDIEEPSSIEELKGLLMKFTAMTHIRLQSILPILIDNDIDDPDILLLIDNEQFLHDIRGKNGSEISRGNSLLLWHGIQELRKKSNSNISSAFHTPRSFLSSSSSTTSSSLSSSPYSTPPSSSSSRSVLVNHDLIASRLMNPQKKSKKQKINHHHHHHNEKDEIQNLNNQRHQYNHASHNHHNRNNHDRNNHNIRNYNHNIRNYSIDNNDDIHDYNDNNSNEVHTRVNRVLSVVTSENNRRKQIALTHNPNCKPTLKFEDFVAELKRSHRIPVAFGTLRDMRFAYMLKILSKQCYDRVLASNKTTNVTEFYRACQEACEENFTDEQLESALPWLDLKAKMYYKQQQ
nr:6916_t:CDS:2 [Entrophospora candida]